jgi:hypothetical protein
VAGSRRRLSLGVSGLGPWALLLALSLVLALFVPSPAAVRQCGTLWYICKGGGGRRMQLGFWEKQ